jgi:sterol desaturase/sphingolipid hydroxylase (fatty acid hydroxylase superfamily)
MTFLRFLAYPSVMALMLAAIAWGVAADLPLEAIAVVPALFGGAIAWGLERLLPYEASWAKGRGDVPVDVAHLVVSFGFVPALYQASLALVLSTSGAALSTVLAMPLWPSTWPLLAQVVLALAVSELGYYAAHRVGHAWLFRFHATHHSAHRLYWLNVVRFHPVDALLQLVGQIGPLALLGASPTVVAVVVAITSVHGVLHHSNTDFRLGFLNRLINGPELHRWHHVPDARRGHNYGQLLSIYDTLFGTYYLPDQERPRRAGLGSPYPQSYFEQLLAPFR